MLSVNDDQSLRTFEVYVWLGFWWKGALVSSQEFTARLHCEL